jgi:hypothetical protein
MRLIAKRRWLVVLLGVAAALAPFRIAGNLN